MTWISDGGQISKTFLFVLMQLTNVTDTRIHTHTPHDGIGRAYASHRAAKKTRLRAEWIVVDCSEGQREQSCILESCCSSPIRRKSLLEEMSEKIRSALQLCNDAQLTILTGNHCS